MAADYTYADLLEAYSSLGVTSGTSVYLATDLRSLMRYESSGREALLSGHMDCLNELLGGRGSLYVPTATIQLCNTDTPFDVHETASRDMGAFSEYVRTQPGAARSFHPFWSLAGVGSGSAEMLTDVSRHAYGHGSVWQRFVDQDVLALTVGLPPRFSLSVIHYIETVVGVPYRYTKEFIHPVVREGGIHREPFYLSVVYAECDVLRDKNREIMKNFAEKGLLKKVSLGRGEAWSFSLREFFEVTASFLTEDIYGWLELPPENRPYQH